MNCFMTNVQNSKQHREGDNNELKIFNNAEFGSIRTAVINNEPYLVGKDVAISLGYTNPRKALIDHVDDEDKGVTKCDTLGGMQEMTVINESGVYSLVFSSKLPTADKEGLKKAIKGGASIDGVALIDKKNIQIK